MSLEKRQWLARHTPSAAGCDWNPTAQIVNIRSQEDLSNISLANPVRPVPSSDGVKRPRCAGNHFLYASFTPAPIDSGPRSSPGADSSGLAGAVTVRRRS